MKLSILRLFGMMGDADVRYQGLSESVENISVRKCGDVKVTFVTDKQFISPDTLFRGDGEYWGIVVWLPREKLEAALAQIERENTQIDSSLTAAIDAAEKIGGA